jgi:hypothetical protein
MPVSDTRVVRIFGGLDLGQVNDRSALVLLVRTVTHSAAIAFPQAERPVSVAYDLRFVERWPLGTGYPSVVSRVAAVYDGLARQFPGVRMELAFDCTGVGRAVGDLLRGVTWPRGLSSAQSEPGVPLVSVVPISIHGGDASREANSRLYVPKRDLIASLVVLFQSGSLRIAAGVKEQDVLLNELVNFRGRMTAGGHDTYANAAGTHGAANDDLVSACAFAAFRASLSRPAARNGPLLRF